MLKTKTYNVPFCHIPVGAKFRFFHDGGRLDCKHGLSVKIDDYCFKCQDGVVWNIGDRRWDVKVFEI